MFLSPGGSGRDHSLIPKPKPVDYLTADPNTVVTDVLPSVAVELVSVKADLVLGNEPNVEEHPDNSLSGALARLRVVLDKEDEGSLLAEEPSDEPSASKPSGLEPEDTLGKGPNSQSKKKGKHFAKYNPIPIRHATVQGGVRRREKYQEIFLGTQHLLELINQLKGSRLSSKEDSLEHKVKLTSRVARWPSPRPLCSKVAVEKF
jgi:hypothetical protein